jgi:hypothetical protein
MQLNNHKKTTKNIIESKIDNFLTKKISSAKNGFFLSEVNGIASFVGSNFKDEKNIVFYSIPSMTTSEIKKVFELKNRELTKNSLDCILKNGSPQSFNGFNITNKDSFSVNNDQLKLLVELIQNMPDAIEITSLGKGISELSGKDKKATSSLSSSQK